MDEFARAGLSSARWLAQYEQAAEPLRAFEDVLSAWGGESAEWYAWLTRSVWERLGVFDMPEQVPAPRVRPLPGRTFAPHLPEQPGAHRLTSHNPTSAEAQRSAPVVPPSVRARLTAAELHAFAPESIRLEMPVFAAGRAARLNPSPANGRGRKSTDPGRPRPLARADAGLHTVPSGTTAVKRLLARWIWEARSLGPSSAIVKSASASRAMFAAAFAAYEAAPMVGQAIQQAFAQSVRPAEITIEQGTPAITPTARADTVTRQLIDQLVEPPARQTTGPLAPSPAPDAARQIPTAAFTLLRSLVEPDPVRPIPSEQLENKPLPASSASPAVQNTFNIMVHSNAGGDADLSDQIVQILIDQARRHGIHLNRDL